MRAFQGYQAVPGLELLVGEFAASHRKKCFIGPNRVFDLVEGVVRDRLKKQRSSRVG